MAKTSGPRIGLTRWSAGTDSVARADFDGDHGDIDSLMMIYLQGTLGARPAASTPGRVYTVWGDGTSENNRKQFYDTGTTWIAVGSYGNDVLNEASAAGNTALVVRGAASQSADIFSVKNSSNANLFRVTYNGVVTNQVTPGTSAGGYIGMNSSHAAAGLFNSVGTGVPVLIAKGALGQTADVLAVQASTGSNLFRVDASGVAYASGALNAPSANIAGTLTVGSISNTGGSVTLKNVVASPVITSDTPLVARGLASQTGNLFAVQNNSNTNLLRVTNAGSLSTSGKIKIGNGSGADSGEYISTDPTLMVYGQGLDSNTAVARIIGGSGSTGNLFEIRNSIGTNQFWVTNAGNTNSNGTVSASRGYLGTSSGTPLTVFGTSYTPRLEVLTGSDTGTFDDSVVFRHAATSSSAVSRSVGLSLKLGDEANSGKSALSAGIAVYSSDANSANPKLMLRVGGEDQGSIDNEGTLAVNNKFWVSPGATGEKLRLYSSEAYSLGVQSSSVYFRTGGAFSWYKGGTFTAGLNDPGSGGTMLMDLDSGGLLTASKFETKSTTGGGGSAVPAIRVGPVTTTHMNIGNQYLDTWTSSAQTVSADLRLQYNGDGGVLVLGNTATQVALPSRTLWTGSNRVYWGSSVWAAQGGGPIANDWWFDFTNNQIKVRNDAAQWKIVADDATFA